MDAQPTTDQPQYDLEDKAISGAGVAADAASIHDAERPLAKPETGTKPAPAVPTPFLTADEQKELSICEQMIDSGLEKAIEVAIALSTIRERRLYRATDKTFEAYCERRYGLRVRQAYRILSHFETLKAINGVEPGECVQLDRFTIQAPESQTRPFLSLPLEVRGPAWQEAVATAPKGVMTAKHGSKVVNDWKVKLGLVKAPDAATTEGPANVIELPDGKAKEEKIRPVVALTVATVRNLVHTIGTPDSMEAANVGVALELLQAYQDHLAKCERLQSGRGA